MLAKQKAAWNQLPRPPAPVLPPQRSQDSSTRSIPPSSSSLTSPSHLSSRPTWPGQQSRVSSTLHSHSHSAHHTQPRSNRPSTESTGHADAHTPSLPPAAAGRQRSTNGQLPARISKLPARAITPQRKLYRYCQPCGIIKPPRAHHCRTCDTVRLFYSSCRMRIKGAHEVPHADNVVCAEIRSSLSL